MEITTNLDAVSIPFDRIEPGQLFRIIGDGDALYCKLDGYGTDQTKELNAGIGYNSVCISSDPGQGLGFLTNCSDTRCTPANKIHLIFQTE